MNFRQEKRIFWNWMKKEAFLKSIHIIEQVLQLEDQIKLEEGIV